MLPCVSAGSFFFNDTATTEIYTLSLHDALPIFDVSVAAPLSNPVLDRAEPHVMAQVQRDLTDCHRLVQPVDQSHDLDRKSTRLNSSHANISYAVFCLKKQQLTLVTPQSDPHTST